MGCEQTPRRSRRSWNQAAPVSVRDALLSSVRDLSIVSEVDSISEPPELEEKSPPRRGLCQTPSIAWEVPATDFRQRRPDPGVVSSLSKERNNCTRGKRNKPTAEAQEPRRNRRTWATSAQEETGRLTGIRSRVREATATAPKAKKPTQAKHDAKKLLSTSRARQRVLKSRSEDFAKAIRLLDTKSPTFRRAPSPEREQDANEEEACIMEVQRTAFDRWEKAVDFAKQALEEVMEAEKVLGFAAEFDQLKDMMDTRGADWDVGIDKYIDLYKNLQTAYPETTPIRRSKISRRQPLPRAVEKKPAPRTRPEMPPLSIRPPERSNSGEEKFNGNFPSFIPSCSGSTAASQRFDPSYILTLGRRFAHSAETWFLKLIHQMVGIEVCHSVYCREDCYKLMEGLSKLQNWLLTAKGTTRMDRHEVLLARLRDTVIRWSSQMFELPLAKTGG